MKGSWSYRPIPFVCMAMLKTLADGARGLMVCSVAESRLYSLFQPNNAGYQHVFWMVQPVQQLRRWTSRKWLARIGMM